jgi:hypothetical protein
VEGWRELIFQLGYFHPVLIKRLFHLEYMHKELRREINRDPLKTAAPEEAGIARHN